jgi:hypothetical protein
MKSFGRILGLIVLVVAFAVPLSAPQSIHSEGYACPELVTQALTATNRVCDGTSRNQACYGHIQLTAQPQASVDHFVFDQEGDVANVFDMQSLRLSAMDTDLGAWGVALMRLQASLPESTKENITLLLFGEVEVQNAVDPTAVVDVEVNAAEAINVRLTPSTKAITVATAEPGETLTATGRLTDLPWLRVQLADGRTGWIYSPLVSSAGDLDTLAVVDPSSVYYSPMQAFYFQSGMDDAACPEAPNSGFLIQTPEGVGHVTFLINEVDIQLGSTVFFEAQPDSEMTVSVVEGSATVTAGGVSYRAIAGTQIDVPMSEKMQPSGAPSKPHAYSMETVGALPVQYLPRVVEVHPPLTPTELTTYLESPESGVPAASETASTGGSTSSEFPVTTGSGWQTAPGLEGATPPGHGGTPPGQEGKDPKDPKPPKP